MASNSAYIKYPRDKRCELRTRDIAIRLKLSILIATDKIQFYESFNSLLGPVSFTIGQIILITRFVSLRYLRPDS
ncbi:hypothetical protein D3C75_1085320 [compost metagenome]